MMRQFVTMLVLWGTSASAFAKDPEPAKPDPATTAAGSVRGAEEIGAKEVPQAALYLQLAKENLEAAAALKADGKKDDAASLVLRAEADAELALLLAREEKEKNEAGDAMEAVRKFLAENK